VPGHAWWGLGSQGVHIPGEAPSWRQAACRAAPAPKAQKPRGGKVRGADARGTPRVRGRAYEVLGLGRARDEEGHKHAMGHGMHEMRKRAPAFNDASRAYGVGK